MDYKKSVVYEIYPKSFCDTKGTGVGDLKGITSKLDYLQNLGVDYLWLCPFFVSPQVDNGYDVEDYYSIDPRYGTMEDFEELAREAEKRGIGLMLDMVFNHTSDRHIWFRKALKGDPYYKNFYIFKKGKEGGGAPTNWQSRFGGSAWEYVPEFDEYYLHLYAMQQPDLNWENPDVRAEVEKVVRFWMEKGVKGFRFDVINQVSKKAYEDDPDGDGTPMFTDGPRIHEFLKELNEQSFGRDPEIITVGEMAATKMESCFRYANPEEHELTMVFSFHHMRADFAGDQKWVLAPVDFMGFKKIMFSWQTKMAEHGSWNALFLDNHDQPRIVSRFGSEDEYWKESAKMLGTLYQLLRGTPFIYQGEELGMTNGDFKELSDYRDVESINNFHILTEKGLSSSDALRILQKHSRDNARTPMQWSSEKHAGFSQGEPWMKVNPNYERINAQAELLDEDSVFHYYRQLIQLRKQYEVVSDGDVRPLGLEDERVFAFERSLGEESLVVICNFYGRDYTWKGELDLSQYQILLSNYPEHEILDNAVWLKPFEAVVLYRKGEQDE